MRDRNPEEGTTNKTVSIFGTGANLVTFRLENPKFLVFSTLVFSSLFIPLFEAYLLFGQTGLVCSVFVTLRSVNVPNFSSWDFSY